MPGKSQVVGVHHEHLVPDSGVVLSSDRTFGSVFAAFWLIVGLAPLLHAGRIRGWSVLLAAIFAAAAIAAPRTLHLFNLAWAKLALLLHHIISPVAMAILFFAAFATTGAFLRLFGKDLLRLRKLSQTDSYWIPRQPPGPPPETMIHQF